MKDWINKLAKLPDHWRGTVAGGAVLASTLTLVSCSIYDGKVASSSSGEQLNREGLHTEYIQASNSLEVRWDEADDLATKADQMKIMVIRDADRVDADFEFDYTAAESEVAKRSEVFGQLAGILQAAVPATPWLGPLMGIGLAGLAGGTSYDALRKNRVITNMKAAKPPGTA